MAWSWSDRSESSRGKIRLLPFWAACVVLAERVLLNSDEEIGMGVDLHKRKDGGECDGECLIGGG